MRDTAKPRKISIALTELQWAAAVEALQLAQQRPNSAPVIQEKYRETARMIQKQFVACRECRATGGGHRMDCNRGRRHD